MESCVLVLARALLLAAMDNGFKDWMAMEQRATIWAEFEKIRPEGWLVNPVKKVQLYVWRKQHQLMVTKMEDTAIPGCNNVDGGADGPVPSHGCAGACGK
jgi:hypothetical protein